MADGNSLPQQSNNHGMEQEFSTPTFDSNGDMYLTITTYLVVPAENNMFDDFFGDEEDDETRMRINIPSAGFVGHHRAYVMSQEHVRVTPMMMMMTMPGGGIDGGDLSDQINGGINGGGGGLSDEEIETCVKITRNILSDQIKDEICAVCLDDLDCYKSQENDRTVGSLRCGHEYHVDCIGRWLRIKNFCPLCKGSALEEEDEEEVCN